MDPWGRFRRCFGGPEAPRSQQVARGDPPAALVPLGQRVWHSRPRATRRPCGWPALADVAAGLPAPGNTVDSWGPVRGVNKAPLAPPEPGGLLRKWVTQTSGHLSRFFSTPNHRINHALRCVCLRRGEYSKSQTYGPVSQMGGTKPSKAAVGIPRALFQVQCTRAAPLVQCIRRQGGRRSAAGAHGGEGHPAKNTRPRRRCWLCRGSSQSVQDCSCQTRQGCRCDEGGGEEGGCGYVHGPYTSRL